MFDYEVRFVFESVNVVAHVIAEDKWHARRLAEVQIYDSTGFDMFGAAEVLVEEVASV